MSLIAQQTKCIDRMHAPRTSDKRAAKNRRAAVRGFRDYAEGAGYDAAEVRQQIQDIWDMYHLQQNSED